MCICTVICLIFVPFTRSNLSCMLPRHNTEITLLFSKSVLIPKIAIQKFKVKPTAGPSLSEDDVVKKGLKIAQPTERSGIQQDNFEWQLEI